ncbi:MAG: T9SS type A sorting domain-containing protein [Microscillaceae bacterium]|nr:T9SS type A sorting domain-containing protein [Microscillaceae bacterium]
MKNAYSRGLSLHNLLKNLLFLFSVCFFPLSVQAQFNTPTINGSIGTNEYGIHTNGSNQQTVGGQTWFMTWDATNLYIAVTNANRGEGMVVYIDTNPTPVIGSGNDSNGSNVGQGYDNTNFAKLPFRAELVMYVKNDYREFRTSNGSNGWSSATTGFGTYSDNGSNLREIAIPWSAMGGRPASFAWFGYVTTSSGLVYGQMPGDNIANNIGTSARYQRYFIVNSTNNSSSIPPFSRNCFVFNYTANPPSFGAVAVYDFTMDSPGNTLTRTSGNWVISNLIINQGTVNLGEVNDDCNLGGDLTIGSSGTLNMTSVNAGSDLFINGNWTNNGTFNANGRAVFFQGANAQSINGATTFAYLIINKSANDVTVVNDISVSGNTGEVLQINNAGRLFLLGANITLSGNGGNIYVSGTNGSSNRSIVGTSGRVIFNGNKTVVNANDRTLQFESNVTVELQSGNIDFGQNSGIYLTQIDGILDIKSTSARVVGNPPTYGSGSLLKYNVGGAAVYNRGVEWSRTADPGYPYNVQITDTKLNLGALAPATAVELANDLTIDAGAALLMNGTIAGASDANDMTATLTIKADLILNGELSLSDKSGGDLVLEGQWNNAGNFVPASRSVTFNGIAPQNIVGTTTFYTLIQNSQGADDLKLLANVNINHLVEVQSGDIHLNKKNMFLADGARIVEDRSANGFVIMDKSVGLVDANPGGYIEINNQTVNADGTAFDPANEIAGLGVYLASSVASYNDLTVRRYNYSGSGVGIRKTFMLSSVSVAANPTRVALEFGEKDVNDTPLGIDDIDRMFRYTVGTNWTIVDATSPVPNVLETDDAQAAFSTWTVGSASLPLPVRLVAFKVEKNGLNQAKITWQTTEEVDNQGFSIEKSPDGISFQAVGWADAKGRLGQITDYQWIDRDFTTSSYYRLKQVDKTGAYNYSRVVFAESADNNSVFKVFPNPIQDKINLNVNLADNTPVKIQILDTQGKTVFENELAWQQAQTTLNQQAQNFQRGVYILRLWANRTVYTAKFLK